MLSCFKSTLLYRSFFLHSLFTASTLGSRDSFMMDTYTPLLPKMPWNSITGLFHILTTHSIMKSTNIPLLFSYSMLFSTKFSESPGRQLAFGVPFGRSLPYLLSLFSYRDNRTHKTNQTQNIKAGDSSPA